MEKANAAVEIHQKLEISKGGSKSAISNMDLRHKECHRQAHERRNEKEALSYIKRKNL